MERIFPALCRVTGLEELIGDERFNTRAQIYRHQAQFRPYLERAMLGRAAAEWEPLLSEAGIPAQIIFTADEAARDPQALAAGFFDTAAYDNGVRVNLPRTPLQFDSFNPPPISACGPVGRDSEHILEELGYAETQLSTGT